MFFAPRFRQGMKAAIPIWIAFVPSSVAWGIAAQNHGLALEEVVLMSAWVYSGPAQFAVLGPLAENRSALQILVAGFLMNLRFLPMSTALAPFFRGVQRVPLLLASHVISASSFIVPYLQFQKERQVEFSDGTDLRAVDGLGNLVFFLGVGATSFVVWVTGTAAGFGVALGFPPGLEEVLKFILPGYFAGLLVIETRDWAPRLICLGSLAAAVAGARINPDWGWLATSIAIATLGWGIEEWKSRASRSS
jgi:predicted branched-subunit amino acid permease